MEILTLVIKVETIDGEESTWLTGINQDELETLKPLFNEIKKNNGYFPTGKFLKEPDPKPEILYSSFPGWSILTSRLPTPSSGFKQITEVHIMKSLISLYM